MRLRLVQLNAMVCSVCKQHLVETGEKRNNATLIGLVGGKKYCLCCCCQQPVMPPWPRSYKARWWKWMREHGGDQLRTSRDQAKRNILGASPNKAESRDYMIASAIHTLAKAIVYFTDYAPHAQAEAVIEMQKQAEKGKEE